MIGKTIDLQDFFGGKGLQNVNADLNLMPGSQTHKADDDAEMTLKLYNWWTRHDCPDLRRPEDYYNYVYRYRS
jgi:hypothetical protein